MNADAITKGLMREITAQVAVPIAAQYHIEDAISRAVESIISGLTNADVEGRKATRSTQPDGRGVATEQYAEGPPWRDEASPLLSRPCCCDCPLITSSKTRHDRPVASSTTESCASAPACGPERVADSGQPLPAQVCGWPYCAPAEAAIEQVARLSKELAEAREGFMAMKSERDAFAATNVEIATHNIKLKATIARLTPQTESERAMIGDLARRLLT